MKTRPLRLLIISAVAMIAGLVALTAALYGAAVQLASVSSRIASDSVPRIVTLEAAASDVRELAVLLEDRVSGTLGDPAIGDARIAAARRSLSEHVSSYLSLPAEPGEAPLRGDIGDAGRALDRVVELVLSKPAGNPPVAQPILHDLHRESRRLDAVLLLSARFNSEQTLSLGKMVSAVPRRWLFRAVALDALSIAAAVVAMSVAARAVRDRTRAEARSRERLENKAEELEAFSGTVAHDLLSPLMTVGLALGVAEQKLPPGEVQPRIMLARAASSLLRVRQLVQDLLEFARAGARPAAGARADARQVIDEVMTDVAPVAEAARVDLRVEASSKRFVQCSVGVLTSLVSNLVQNAIKHLGASDIRRVAVRALDDGPCVRIEVEDTGPGVAPADQERIFEPFVRGPDSRVPGVGLGLALFFVASPRTR